MQRDQEAEDYTELFLTFSNGMESFLKKAVIVALAGLCVCQIVLRIPALRAYIASADRYEGVALDRPGER
ncbi:hypothetical protein YSY43_24110 [Paenibacillus sp. YSY-4.3]